MKPQHIGVVWNPSKVTREELEAAFKNYDGEVTWHETTIDDAGVAATRAAIDAGAQTVFAAGGDGTVRAVIEVLAGETNETDEPRVELGIIPLGTGNLLARNLGVPLGNARAAVRWALDSEQASPIDIGWAQLTLTNTGKHTKNRFAFAVMAGFGIDAHMITETSDDLKENVGWIAYVESLGRALSASEVIGLNLTIDDNESRNEDAHTLIVGNCGSIQAGITVLPDADPSDGHLDLLVLNADSVAGWLDTMRNMVWVNGVRRLFKKQDPVASSTSVTHEQCTHLTLKLSEPRVFEVDGDDLGETTEAEIEVQPRAVRVRGF